MANPVGKRAFDDQFSIESQHQGEMAVRPARFQQLVPAVDVDVGQGPVVEPNSPPPRVVLVTAAVVVAGGEGPTTMNP